MRIKFLLKTLSLTILVISCLSIDQSKNIEKEIANTEVVRNVLNAIEAKNEDNISPLLSDDFELELMTRNIPIPTKYNKEFFVKQYLRVFENLEIRVLDIVAEEDKLLFEFNLRGNDESGKPYRNTFALNIEMKDRKIKKIKQYMDTAMELKFLFPSMVLVD
mmetsp:Transcript_15674/g.16267  ORF Transcript_15674/g.16267 Transcript_15674/m.16267 type:complete len:162 (-) Transcript_15674:60-545(-)